MGKKQQQKAQEKVTHLFQDIQGKTGRLQTCPGISRKSGIPRTSSRFCKIKQYLLYRQLKTNPRSPRFMQELLEERGVGLKRTYVNLHGTCLKNVPLLSSPSHSIPGAALQRTAKQNCSGKTNTTGLRSH